MRGVITLRLLLLAFIAPWIDCQTEQQFQCVEEYVDANPASVDQIMQQCNSENVVPGDFRDLCANTGSNCYSEFARVYNMCRLDLALFCGLASVTPEQEQCINGSARSVELVNTCGDMTTSDPAELTAICANQACIDLLNEIYLGECNFDFVGLVCTNTGTDGDNMVTDGDPGNGGDNNGDPGNGGDNNSNGSVRGYIVPATMLLAVLISILSS